MAFTILPGAWRQQEHYALAGGTGNLRSDGFNCSGRSPTRGCKRSVRSTAFRQDVLSPQYALIDERKCSGHVQTSSGVIQSGFATGCFLRCRNPFPNGTPIRYASRIVSCRPRSKTSAFLSGAFRVSQAMQLFASSTTSTTSRRSRFGNASLRGDDVQTAILALPPTGRSIRTRALMASEPVLATIPAAAQTRQPATPGGPSSG